MTTNSSDTNGPTDPPPQPQRVAGGLGRIAKIALVVSLSLNLLLIGALAGGAMRASRFQPAMEGQADYRALWRALPDEARAQMRAQARERGGGGERPQRRSREERREISRARNQQIIALLRADPFDSAAFAQVLTQDRRALEDRLNATRLAFVSQVEGLDHTARQTMADALEQTLRRHRNRRRQ